MLGVGDIVVLLFACLAIIYVLQIVKETKAP